MRTLRLLALSDDGTRMVLAADGTDGSDPGERFEVVIDDRVRAAARGDAHRLGQIELDLGTALSPRVIQSRIRAGESPEQVAEASGTKVERILRFAHPVLLERARVAEQARDARVRLSEGTTGTPLQQFVAERLRLLGGDVDEVSWDAHRGEDGTWLVSVGWRSEHKAGTTVWAFDLPARTATPADAATTDFAEGTRLVRVVPDVPTGAPSRPVSVLRGPAPPPREDVATEPSPAPGTPTPEQEEDPDAHDTVVLGRLEDLAPEEPSDPRATIPAWEDIVFGVRRRR
ncbi:DUF3071 domain-containing protein [Modestobacter sp. I12A-02628]|uniref:DUF3071 domain-containing protein n=1 Tax=Goekera deserti TaxID=2497753 RepID=A0A7K3WLL9_9ACTN|nr:septation protein SepH [Goekera deserti]MPQ99326.1 DUF3071 domain-containing protein [Goekera deserti]NDI50325.1 DUF3071 domain-containing protein [Goekera deserti]NEL56423.1 DUF3071 domain-containing protein [Goekera deserti]